MGTKIDIAKELKKSLTTQFGSNIKDVILFGSRANGTASASSDYDILVILKNDYDWKYKNNIVSVVYNLELQQNIMIDIHLLSTNEINSLKGLQPIFFNALNNGLYA